MTNASVWLLLFVRDGSLFRIVVYVSTEWADSYGSDVFEHWREPDNAKLIDIFLSEEVAEYGPMQLVETQRLDLIRNINLL